MRLRDIQRIDEKKVKSVWLKDVKYIGRKKIGNVSITIRDGSSYTVHNVPYDVYRQWVISPSKGQYWHKNIKNQYEVS
jgi:hypothetical protein